MMTEQEWREAFAKRLRKLAYKKGPYTQKQLAELSGISEPTISHYMNGSRIPNGNNILRLARALNCSADALIMIDEPIYF